MGIIRKESETGQRQAGEREGFPETMTSNAEEVYASETRDIEPSERRDEGKQREKEQREIDELKESLKNVGEMKQTVTKLESELSEFQF